jgi:CubicO group peptidase (beta-lactamase class C family)
MELDINLLKNTVEGIVKKHQLPGMGIGIVSSQETLFIQGFGYSEIETQTKHSEKTIQRIGSITKTMTALAAIRLVENGKLDMESKVTDLVPSIKFNSKFSSIKVKHLFTHTSGIGEMPEKKDFSAADIKLWGDTGPFDIPNHYPNGIDVDFEPGTDWHYANHAWGILGEIVARVENDSWHNVIQKVIFDKLGMSDSYPGDEPVDGMSVGYHRDSGQDELDRMELIGDELIYGDLVDKVNIRGVKYDYVGTAAAGSVMSTLEDMCTYSRALLNKSNGIISQDTFDSMLEIQYSPDPDLSIKMGLGFQIKSIMGHYAYGHNGGISGGWNTVMLLFPKLDIGLMIHLNLSSGLVDEITDDIVYVLLGKPSINIVKTTINDEQKNKIIGVYIQRPGFVARSRPIRSLGRIQIIEKDNNVYIQSRRGEWREATKIFKSDYGSNIYVVDDGKINPTLISINGDTLTVDRLASLDKDNRAKTW